MWTEGLSAPHYYPGMCWRHRTLTALSYFSVSYPSTHLMLRILSLDGSRRVPSSHCSSSKECASPYLMCLEHSGLEKQRLFIFSPAYLATQNRCPTMRPLLSLLRYLSWAPLTLWSLCLLVSSVRLMERASFVLYSSVTMWEEMPEGTQIRRLPR